MIQVTDFRTNKPFYINKQYIVALRPDPRGTHIVVSRSPIAYLVVESIDEIYRLLEE